MPPLKSKTANSLLEYLLPVGLLVVVLVVGLVTFQDSFKASFQSGIQGKTTSNSNRMTMKKLGEFPGKTLNLTLDNGKTLSLEGYPDNIQLLVETNGVNGTTEVLLAQLNQLIQQLEEGQLISPEEIAILKEMSNKGHQIGNQQKIIEGSVQACGSSKQCVSDALRVNETLGNAIGSSYVVSKEELQRNPILYNSVKNLTPSTTEALVELEPNSLDVLKGNNTFHNDFKNMMIGEDLSNFLESFSRFKNAQGRQNPQLMALVKDIGRNISTLSIATTNYIYTSSNLGRKENPAELYSTLSGIMKKRQELYPSDILHGESGHLCILGKGEDEKTHCS